MTYRRADYITERARMVQEPLADALPAQRPLWHECLSVAVLVAVLAILAWWH